MVQILKDNQEDNTQERSLYDFLAAVYMLKVFFEADSNDDNGLEKYSAKICQPDFAPSHSERPFWTASHRNREDAIPAIVGLAGSRTDLLMDSFDFCRFDIAIIITGCLQRFEPCYGRAIARLKDNSTSALIQSLALRLLCPGQFLRNYFRTTLLHDAPLVCAGLLELHKNSTQLNDTVIQTSDKVCHLLPRGVLPEFLASLLEWRQSAHSVWLDDEALKLNWQQRPDGFPCVIELRPAPSIDPKAAAISLGLHIGLKALAVDPQILLQFSERKFLKQLALGAARLHRALLCLPKVGVGGERKEEWGEAVSWSEFSEIIRDTALPVCCCTAVSGASRPQPSRMRWVFTPCNIPSYRYQYP
ncbi:TPA: hypothetical protein QH957_004517 [Enterobacter bugandensis]|nr:hypothetical protein [Enterobacter bugandensis]